MRHLVVCCDGTWNTPEQETNGIPAPTNVVRLRNALADVDNKGNPQLSYYHPGVGTGGLIDRILGGGAGQGLSKNVMSAYQWLAYHYQPGDRISLFGYSRGAYTVRSLSGMITRCGLLKITDTNPKSVWKKISRVYDEGYRPKNPKPTWNAGLSFHRDEQSDVIAPHLVGVWDTVGALGIPDSLGLLNLFERQEKYRFHDVQLSPLVPYGRHAVALDEQRGPFAPTLWGESAAGQELKQVWFPGNHGDVGGGHPQTGLSDAALLWMIEEAEQTADLVFQKAVLDQLRPNHLDILHGTSIGLFRRLAPQPRTVPIIDRSRSAAVVHKSAFDRQDNPPIAQSPYRGTRVLAPGESTTVDVYAREQWNFTGLYLDAGRYTFTAEGEWVDKGLTCGPAGVKGLRLHPARLGQLTGSLLGRVERLVRKASKNPAGQLQTSRREDDLPWMSLVGWVANGPIDSEETCRHRAPERIAIGNSCTHQVPCPGYLYAYANDAWGQHSRNRGSVALTVTRAQDE